MKRLKALKLVLTVMITGYSLFGGLTLASVAAAPSIYEATSSSLQSDACSGLSTLDSSETCDKSGGEVGTTIGNIVNLLSIIIGAVAVIMVLVASLRYITSGGEAEKVSGAKRALTYALVGVAIAAIAQLLVHFVLNQTDIKP